MADYKYDLFVSVKTNSVYDQWVKEYILGRLVGYLRNDVIAICGRQLGPYYFYQNELKAGDPWPEDLKEAINRSRVALALCSPEYFLAKWCYTEFESFKRRAEETKRRLLIPVRIHDCEHWPPDFNTIWAADFREFMNDAPGFLSTPRGAELPERLQRLSRVVAKRIAEAPDFMDWPIVDTVVPAAAPVRQLTLA